MRTITTSWIGGAVFAASCLLATAAFAQGNNAAASGKAQGNSSGTFQAPQKTDEICIANRDACGKVPGKVAGGFLEIHPLPAGGPAPRMSDGHVDLTGRWYPNAAGRMLQAAYPLDRNAFRQFDPKATPEEKPSYKPGMEKLNARPFPYGDCDQPGTPGATLQQISQHAPMELISTPQRVVMLDEYPLDVRMIYLNRPHPKDPDPTFNGDSAAHWEGDTLVVDVTAIDTRLRNAIPGDTSSGWFPSEKEHVVERFTRPSKNYLIYQVTVDDPDVLTKPWKSAPRIWTVAQDLHDEWGEVFCTLNQEPEEYKKITDARQKTK